MNYEETIDFLYKQLPVFQRTGKAAYKANLNNTHILDEFFLSPHKEYKCIHVAGTNGKGSVSHMLTSILMEAGYKVGLYTSPHLKSFRERIKVNGKMISKDYIVEFVNNAHKLINDLNPSFFELTVAMAFKYFADCNVDVAVIEVGLGGRLDSTNIIIPDLSIITNIGFDHTEFLGDSIEKIAGEKAGIIKPGVPVVIGQTSSESENVFLDTANRNNSKIYFADQDYKIELTMNSLDNKKIYSCVNKAGVEYKDLKLDLLGNYQGYNLLTVLKSTDQLNCLGYNISKDNLYAGLEDVVENTGVMGRWQTLGYNPKIIADTGHNFDGVSEVIKQLKNCAFKKLHMVIGFVNDKNIDEILKLFPQDAKYYFTKANIPRALETEILFKKATSFGLEGSIYQSVNEALVAAKKYAESEDMIFVGGSTFVVAEVV